MSNFRLRKKPRQEPMGESIAPVDNSSSSGKVETVSQGRVGVGRVDPPQEVRTCHAFLEAFAKKPTAKSTHGNVGNYAVIGRGFAATVNLATLRSEWGRSRVHRSGKGRNLVVIGYPDPWGTYVRHHMNQEFELLTLPGYHQRPDWSAWSAERRWLDSRVFSAINAEELQRHLGEEDKTPLNEKCFFNKHLEVNAGVTRIERIESRTRKGFFRYRLHFNDPEASSLVASKVDICTGTGQQTFVERGKGSIRAIDIPDEVLWNEYRNPQGGDTLPRLWSAEMYVAGDRQFKEGGSVLITSAASPAGIQAGEHALGLDLQGRSGPGGSAAELVMVASRKMNDGFLPIGRLDAMARTAQGPLRTRLRTDPRDVLYPTDERAWFGENYRVASVELLSERHVRDHEHEDGTALDLNGKDKGKLFVTFQDADSPREGLRAGSPVGQPVKQQEAVLEFGLFDQVVFNTGRNRGGREGAPKDEPGSAMQLVWPFMKLLVPIHDGAGCDFPVGLQTDDGRLRVLGAAGINNPLYCAAPDANKFRSDYQESLPLQARVAGEGVTLAAVTIAMANRYWANSHNPNLNTATLADLTKMLGKETAKAVHAMRHMRVRPLTSRLEATLASAFWSCYFQRTVPTSNFTDPRWRRGDEFPEVDHFPRLVHEINDFSQLQDWKATRSKPHLDESGGEPFKEAALDAAVLRYADHIQDPVLRARVAIEGP